MLPIVTSAGIARVKLTAALHTDRALAERHPAGKATRSAAQPTPCKGV